MQERVGAKDVLIVGLLAGSLALSVFTLLQKNNDARVLVDEVKETQKQIAGMDRNLSQTNVALRELVSVLRAGDGGVKAGGADLKKALARVDDIDARPVGDELVWGFAGTEPANINPLTGRDMYSRYVTLENRVFEFLITRDRMTMEWTGVLAKSWEVAADGRSVTYKLRPEARWSDGRPVTADDVVFTVNLAKNPLTDCPQKRTYLTDIDSVEALDTHTVRFNLAKKYFLCLDGTGNTVPVLPKHVYEKYVGKSLDDFEFNKITGKNAAQYPLVASGPYALEKWKTGEEITLVRNENYWGRRPSLDRVRFRMYLNGTAALADMKKGLVDFILDPQADQFDEMSKDPEFTAKFNCVKWDAPDSGFRYVGYNMRLPIFADKRVRRALTHLLDRQTLLQELDYNLGRVASGYFWAGGRQADPAIKPWPYDVERAKELLAEAGWKPGADGVLEKEGTKFRFNFQISTGRPYYVQFARYFKDQCKKVGIELNVEQFEWAVYSDKLTNRKFDVVCLGWGGGNVEADPYQIWHSSQAENRGSNYVGFVNAAADKLIDAAKEELDETKRNEMFRQWHRILHDEQPYTFLTQRFNCAFIAKRFEVKVGKMGVEPLDWYVPVDRQLRGKGR